MDELLQKQIKDLEFLLKEAERLGKKPGRVVEIWRTAYEEDKAARGSGLNCNDAESYQEFMKSRIEYQKMRVALYLYHNEIPSLFLNKAIKNEMQK